MVTIELRYNRKYTRKLPTKFAELTRKQTLQFVRLLFSNQQLSSLEELPASFKTSFISKLLRVPEKVLYTIGDAGMVQLVTKCAGLFSPNAEVSITSFLLGFKRLYLPKTNFDNLTFIEFSESETWYNRIIQNEGDAEENINMMIAAICKQYRWSWGQWKWIRPGYNFEKQTAVSNRLKKYSFHHFGDANKMVKFRTLLFGVHPDIKNAIFYWYVLNRKELVQKYPAVFSSGSDTNGPDLTSQYGWNRVGMEIASGGEFGTFDEVGSTPVHTILYHISYKNDLAKEQEMKHQIKHG